MNQTINYLMTLPEDEMAAMIAAMPHEERVMLVQTMCHNLNQFVAECVQRKEEIWANRELPPLPFKPSHGETQ